MKWFLLLVATVVTVSGAALKEDSKELAERIVKAEKECADLKTLKESQTLPYTDLLSICEERLNQDKYAYIELNNVDLKQNTEEKFPVTTGQGEELVNKPPQLSSEEVQKKIKDLKDNKDTLSNSGTKRAQEIVDQQVKCALAASKEDDECTKRLNCLKDAFMADEKLYLKDNLDSFPIRYKGKEAKINSPPSLVRDCSEYTQSSTAASSQKSSDKEKQTTDTKGEAVKEDDFAELTEAEKEVPRIKKGNQMVTKGGALDGIATQLLMGAMKTGLGVDSNDNSMVGKILTMATPFLADAMSGGGSGASSKKQEVGSMGGSSIMSSSSGPGVASLGSLKNDHINCLMKVITNRLKKKEMREKINRDDLRAAIEIVTKTVLHFIIITSQVRSNFNGGVNGGVKNTNPFVDNMKVALMDTISSFAVNFLIDQFLPEDEFMDVNEVAAVNLKKQNSMKQTAKKGFFG